jgi:hypothetical protein
VDELPAGHGPGGPGREHLPGAASPSSYPNTAIINGSLIVIQLLTLSPNVLKQISL